MRDLKARRLRPGWAVTPLNYRNIFRKCAVDAMLLDSASQPPPPLPIQMAGRRVTLKDIARQLGLSLPTVSRALADHPDISEETKGRVRECAQAMHYIPNFRARYLRAKNSRLLALILPEMNMFFFPSLITGISKVAAWFRKLNGAAPQVQVTGDVDPIITIKVEQLDVGQLAAADALWLGRYQASAEFKAERGMHEDFGEAYLS